MRLYSADNVALTQIMNREGPTQGGGTQAGSGLERRMANLRSTYWRQYLTAHGSVNDLLMAYQEKPRLRECFGYSTARAPGA